MFKISMLVCLAIAGAYILSYIVGTAIGFLLPST
jgi:hypothetical protein